MVVFQLGGSVPAIATALQLSAFSLMWPLQHRNPPLIGKIRKLQIIKKDLVFVCCRAEQGGKVLLSPRFICWWWLAEIGRKGAISQPLSSLLHPPHCCFTHFKYKDKDKETEKDKDSRCTDRSAGPHYTQIRYKSIDTHLHQCIHRWHTLYIYFTCKHTNSIAKA